MTTLTINENFNITNGPSREALFDALRLRHEGRLVEFTLQDSTDKVCVIYTVCAYIDSIAVEDGSGHNWIVTLRVPTGQERGKLTILNSDPIDVFYSTGTPRRGRVIDSRPLALRSTVDRRGRIFTGGHPVGRI